MLKKSTMTKKSIYESPVTKAFAISVSEPMAQSFTDPMLKTYYEDGESLDELFTY